MARDVRDDGERLTRRIHVNALYDFYAPLLTERQRTVYEMRFFSDLSLVEIAEALQISRQAVYILVNRIAERLETIEKELGFAAKMQVMQDRIDELERRLGRAVRHCPEDTVGMDCLGENGENV